MPLQKLVRIDMAGLNFQNPFKGNRQSIAATLNGKRATLPEADFHQMLARERKRSERSKRPLLLMLLQARDPIASEQRLQELSQLLEGLAPKIRETDVVGWYQGNLTLGVIFTELSADDKSTILGVILDKFSGTVKAGLRVANLSQISVSFHFFPDDWSNETPGGTPNDTALYPDIQTSIQGKAFTLHIKRALDFVVSSLILLIASPLLLVIGAAIKATSKGPVFYTQERVGQYGRHFTCLKFRSMKVDNDCSVHRQYVSQFIAGKADRITTESNADGVYKLANDDRTTPLGRLLRRSSLDELPQLINVLRGEMSLVGPRPPIPYELAVYETWHRGRLLQVKPGLTGLWQVNGRNRVGFDDMVRFDLRYANTWSLWLDIKILLQTPAAVLKGAC